MVCPIRPCHQKQCECGAVCPVVDGEEGEEQGGDPGEAGGDIHKDIEEESSENLFESSTGGRNDFEDKYPLGTTWLHQDQCNDAQLC